MSVEVDEITTLVRRACAVDGQSGEPIKGYIAIYGGPNSKNARKLVAPVQIGADAESIIEQVLRRVSTARAEGAKKLFVRLYETGDSSPADVVVLDGDPNIKDPNELESEGGSLSAAHADVVRGAYSMISRLVDKNTELFSEYAEFRAQAAAAYQEIQVRQQLGWAGDLKGMAESLGPTLEKALPEALRVYYTHQRLVEARQAGEGNEDGGVVTPGGRARKACARLERAVAETVTDLGALVASGEMTDALRMEVGGRLGALLAETQHALQAAMSGSSKATEDAEEVK